MNKTDCFQLPDSYELSADINDWCFRSLLLRVLPRGCDFEQLFGHYGNRSAIMNSCCRTGGGSLLLLPNREARAETIFSDQHLFGITRYWDYRLASIRQDWMWLDKVESDGLKRMRAGLDWRNVSMIYLWGMNAEGWRELFSWSGTSNEGLSVDVWPVVSLNVSAWDC